MSDTTGDERVASHTFPSPEDAPEHFTPERRAAARPRAIRLDEEGRRLPEGTPCASETPSPQDATSPDGDEVDTP